VKRLTGTETLFINNSTFAKNSIQDFWQWAFSDLKMNDVRGVFAEWMVAKLLGIPLTVRDSWSDHDLEIDGMKIEVKCAAYLQSWVQRQPSRIVFSGLRGKVYNYENNTYAENQTYNADVYVFCVQKETDDTKWNALDLRQWEFYILGKKTVKALGQSSISLRKVQQIAPKCTAENLSEFVFHRK